MLVLGFDLEIWPRGFVILAQKEEALEGESVSSVVVLAQQHAAVGDVLGVPVELDAEDECLDVLGGNLVFCALGIFLREADGRSQLLVTLVILVLLVIHGILIFLVLFVSLFCLFLICFVCFSCLHAVLAMARLDVDDFLDHDIHRILETLELPLDILELLEFVVLVLVLERCLELLDLAIQLLDFFLPLGLLIVERLGIRHRRKLGLLVGRLDKVALECLDA